MIQVVRRSIVDVYSQYSFNRQSLAYDSKGRLYHLHNARFEPGKFGKAVLVEEGTTNRLPANIHTWSEYTYEATTYSITNVSTPYGSGVKLTGTSAGRVGKLTTGGINLGTSYATASVYFKPNSASGTLKIYWDTSDDTGARRPGVFGNQAINLANCVPGTWYRLVCTADISPYTFASGGSGFHGFYIWAEGTFDVEIAAPQLEAKPYATSFIDGTRTAESLTIPTAGVLNPQEGTVEFYHLFRSDSEPAPWLVSSSLPNYTQLLAVVKSNANTIRFRTRNLSGTSTVEASVTDGWHYVAARWNSTEIALFIDGVKVGTAANPYLPTQIADIIAIGYNHNNSSQYCNSLIDDLRISNRARTDEEIAAAYASGQPLPVDQYTTLKLPFDGPDGQRAAKVLIA